MRGRVRPDITITWIRPEMSAVRMTDILREEGEGGGVEEGEEWWSKEW